MEPPVLKPGDAFIGGLPPDAGRMSNHRRERETGPLALHCKVVVQGRRVRDQWHSEVKTQGQIDNLQC